MVREIVKKLQNDDVNYYEFAGLSTDDPKPTHNVCTGSLFLEVDTGDVYSFDEEDGEWNKVCELGGGS